MVGYLSSSKARGLFCGRQLLWGMDGGGDTLIMLRGSIIPYRLYTRPELSPFSVSRARARGGAFFLRSSSLASQTMDEEAVVCFLQCPEIASLVGVQRAKPFGCEAIFSSVADSLALGVVWESERGASGGMWDGEYLEPSWGVSFLGPNQSSPLRWGAFLLVCDGRVCFLTQVHADTPEVVMTSEGAYWTATDLCCS